MSTLEDSETGEVNSPRQHPNRHLVQQIATPEDAREHSTLGRIDYCDAFLVARSNAPDRTAERWARTMLEGAPLGRRLSLLGGWTALGLRLGSPCSSQFVLGWQVRQREPDVVLLGVGSRFGLAAELLFERHPQALLFCTFVQLNNPVARAMWSGVAPMHRQVVHHLLAQVAIASPTEDDS